MDRLPAATGHGPQRGHTRPAAVRRRGLQGPRRGDKRSGATLRRSVGGRREQAVRAPPRRSRRARPSPRQDASRPDFALPFGGGIRYRRRDSLGHPHQRRRVASLRSALAPPRHRLLRGRSRRCPPARRRRRFADFQSVVRPQLLRPWGGGEGDLS